MTRQSSCSNIIDHRKNETKTAKHVTTRLLELWRTSAFYIFASFFLLLVILNTDGLVRDEMLKIFTENLAPSSIALFASLGLLLFSLSMLLTGPFNQAKIFNRMLYRYMVFPVLNAGKLLSSAGFGMTAGFFAANLYIGEDAKFVFLSAGNVVIFFIFTSFFHGMEFLSICENQKFFRKPEMRLLLIAVVVALPCYYIFVINMARPVLQACR